MLLPTHPPTRAHIHPFSFFSSLVSGVGLLDRQRKVNEVLDEEMKVIHALTMKTWTPKQFEKKVL